MRGFHPLLLALGVAQLFAAPAVSAEFPARRSGKTERAKTSIDLTKRPTLPVAPERPKGKRARRRERGRSRARP